MPSWGLTAAGRHAGLAELESRLPELIDELRTLGCDRLAVVFWDENDDGAGVVRSTLACCTKQIAGAVYRQVAEGVSAVGAVENGDGDNG